MIIPDSFQLAGIVWTVREQADTVNLGQTFRDKALITLQEELPQQIKEATFCHELVHVIKYMLGHPEPHNEEEVEQWAYYLHQYLKGLDDNSTTGCGHNCVQMCGECGTGALGDSPRTC